ncbi:MULTISPECIES: hypothetical protein [Pseudomonas]|uniref:hypothetical protein n=1 Tax=Pseudomonas TaxID=286 RepID=UPI001BDE0D10|nr:MULTISPECIES: hypothetical protein [Pseudomonas]MCP1454492.1 hypothetical protein [Pseudomonas kilonensis]UVM62547.1 hypothetical protein LOY50_05745 [Pseudomonas sp. B21-010]
MEPQKIGTQFGTRANGVFFTPEQNTTGMIVRTATMHCGALYGILSTGTKKPTGYSDSTVPVILSCRGTQPTSTGFAGASATLPFPVIIPAGQGLWSEITSSWTDTAFVYVTWDPLPVA